MKKITFKEAVQAVKGEDAWAIWSDARKDHWRVKFVGMAAFTPREERILRGIPEVISFGFASKPGHRRHNGAYIRISKPAGKVNVMHLEIVKDILEARMYQKRLERLKGLSNEILELPRNSKVSKCSIYVLKGILRAIKKLNKN